MNQVLWGAVCFHLSLTGIIAKLEWRASFYNFSLIMEIIAIRLLDPRLDWQPHKKCLCPTSRDSPHLAASVHTDGAGCSFGWNTRNNNRTETKTVFVLCFLFFIFSWISLSELWRHSEPKHTPRSGYLHFIVNSRFWGRESLFFASDPVRSYDTWCKKTNRTHNFSEMTLIRTQNRHITCFQWFVI